MREDIPLSAGDSVTINGEEAVVVDMPTGGVQFEFPDRDELFQNEQIPFDEVSDMLGL